MPRCETCSKLGATCTRDKRPAQAKCMRCVRLQSACVIARDKPDPSAARVRTNTPTHLQPATSRQNVTNLTSLHGTTLYSPEQITRILVAIDPGSSRLKAAFKLVRRGEVQKPRVGIDQIIAGIDDVTWRDCTQSVPTQLAFEYSEVAGVYRQLWGEQVDYAVKEQRVQADHVFRSLKPALLCDDADDDIERDGHQLPSPRKRIEQQIDKLPELVRFSAVDQNDPSKRRRLTHADLYSDYIRHAWYWILRHIQQDAGHLPWPQLDGHSLPDGFSPTDSIPIELVMPLPAGTTPAKVDKVVAAAKKAGLPSPYIVAEPAAAYAYDLQKSVEAHGPAPRRGLQLIVDCGGGSVDLQLWRIVSIAPMQAKEVVQGTENWCGGHFINHNFRNFVKDAFKHSMPDLLQQISVARDQVFSEDLFLDEAEASFENEKKAFIGFHHSQAENLTLADEPKNIVLEIPNLPELSATRAKRGRMILSEPDMRKIFDPAFQEIKASINKMIFRYHAFVTSQNAPIESISEIILVGGGSASPHLYERIRREYQAPEGRVSGYPIPVRRPSKNGQGSCSWIAQGALLLLMDQAFLEQRLLRRGFCVVVDEPCAEREAQDPHFDTSIDPHDGEWKRRDVSRFIFRINDAVPFECRRRGPEGCWRAIWVNGPRVISEAIYFCEDPNIDDGVWVHGEKGKTAIMPCGNIYFSLTEEEMKFFERRRSANKKFRKRWYWYIEYRIDFYIRGIEMLYEIVFPRDGRFDGKGRLGPDGGLIRKRGELINITGATAMSNVA